MANILNDIIVVDMRKSTKGAVPEIATRLKNRTAITRHKRKEVNTTQLAIFKNAKVASGFNHRVSLAQQYLSVQTDTLRHAIDERQQSAAFKRSCLQYAKQLRASVNSVGTSPRAVAEKVRLEEAASRSQLVERLDSKMESATKKREEVLELTKFKAASNSLGNSPTAVREKLRQQEEKELATLAFRLETKLESAQKKREEKLEMAKTKAAVNTLGMVPSAVVTKVRAEEDCERCQLAERLERKLDFAEKKREENLEATRSKAMLVVQKADNGRENALKERRKRTEEIALRLARSMETAEDLHQQHVDAVRSKAATVTARHDAVVVQHAVSPKKAEYLAGKIQQELDQASAKRQMVIESVRSKASAVVEKHVAVVNQHRENCEKTAKDVAQKLEQKLAAAEAARQQCLSPKPKPLRVVVDI